MGSGKSTLLAVLARRLKLPSVNGGPSDKLWWHKGLRLAYVAQHSIVHVGECLRMSPLGYMQLRFRRGYDSEMPSVELPAPTQEETEYLAMLAKRHGKKGKTVEALLSRIDWVEED